MIALENSAGGGFGLGVDVGELAGIAEAAAARGIRTTSSGSAWTQRMPGAPESTWPTPTRPTPSSTISTRGSGLSGW